MVDFFYSFSLEFVVSESWNVQSFSFSFIFYEFLNFLRSLVETNKVFDTDAFILNDKLEKYVDTEKIVKREWRNKPINLSTFIVFFFGFFQRL